VNREDRKYSPLVDQSAIDAADKKQPVETNSPLKMKIDLTYLAFFTE
jgi:hypothetical protein